MAEQRLPLLRGQISYEEHFRSPRGGGGGAEPPPSPDPQQHSAKLIAQLDSLAHRAAQRTARDEDAKREVIAVHPVADHELEAGGLADKRKDVRLVATDPASGAVLVDAPSADLPHLRKKVQAFEDDAKANEQGQRKHARVVAPIASLDLAGEEDLAGERLRRSELGPDEVRWFEISCRGGRRASEADTLRSRAQVERQLKHLGREVAAAYLAVHRIVFYARLSLTDLRSLIEAVDCVFEYDLTVDRVRDWLLLEAPPVRALRSFELHPPGDDAPVVTILDTGIATEHPMLRPAIVDAGSGLPEDDSPEDIHGHGTQLAGVALFGANVGAAVEVGGAEAPHWVQSTKLLRSPAVGSAAEANRAAWPSTTIDAVHASEARDRGDRKRAFLLAVTEDDHLELVTRDYWSDALDGLAYDEQRKRLFCVSAGNADAMDLRLLEGYPTLQLQRSIKAPAQAENALTVGAFTNKDSLPPESLYDELEPVAPAGGISPHTTTGAIGPTGRNKPDVVLEGGNVASDGSLPDAGVATLTTLTTNRDFLRAPLTLTCMTSEAAARAARLAAQIWSAEPDLRPETVRGLIVHAASWTPAMCEQFANLDERMSACGYGVPDAGWAQDCLEQRATVIVEDELPGAVLEEVPKKELPKRASTKPTETVRRRLARFFQLPVPDELLVENAEREVELRVTLSYFAEVSTLRRRGYRGLDLRFDVQGPDEEEDPFRRRINEAARDGGEKGAGSFRWDIGYTRRSRGTVQSDRWRGPAVRLAGAKLIAVYPVLGWWDTRPDMRTKSLPFSLIATVSAPGLDVYTPLAVQLGAMIEV